jgi:hypothetical protein
MYEAMYTSTTISSNRVEEMFAKIIITMQVPQAPDVSKSQAKTVIDVGGFHLAPNMTIILAVHALHNGQLENEWVVVQR